MARARKQNKKRNKRLIKGILFCLILCLLFTAIDRCLRPTCTRALEYFAQSAATDLINRAISNAVEQTGYSYDDLAVVTRNDAGNVTSIEANMLHINEIQTNITEQLLNGLRALGDADLSIALGTLSGSIFLSGKGPRVHVTLEIGSAVQNKMRSEFKAVGINQTRHAIVLTTETDIGALLPCYTTNVHIANEFIVAETIIVGTVPNNYTRVIADTSAFLDSEGDTP